MAAEHGVDHLSLWATMASLAGKIDCSPETLRSWVPPVRGVNQIKQPPGDPERFAASSWLSHVIIARSGAPASRVWSKVEKTLPQTLPDAKIEQQS